MKTLLTSVLSVLITLFAPPPGAAHRCQARVTPKPRAVRLITLDPGHFHAALVQKLMYPQVDPVVSVFAPPGEDVQQHLKLIAGFNPGRRIPALAGACISVRTICSA